MEGRSKVQLKETDTERPSLERAEFKLKKKKKKVDNKEIPKENVISGTSKSEVYN